jgi:hypothetical protein
VSRAVVAGSIVAAVSALALAACDVLKPAPDPRYPRQSAGCDVVTFPDGPKVIADNLGSVRAECDARTTDEECLRQLEDEVCKLGGDVAWGVPARPKDIGGGMKVLEARAAHTHISGTGARFKSP